MSNSIHSKYLITGAGLAGLSSAYYLEDNYILAEASGSPGGTSGTLYYNGFKLDNAVHIIYFRHNDLLEWVKSTLGIELIKKQRNSSVWLKNSFIRFPIQYNLSDLPPGPRYLSSVSLLRSLYSNNGSGKFKNFEEYSLSVFGKYLTDIFIRPYNEKLFGEEINNMNIEWMGDYIPKYSRLSMILSAAGLTNIKYGRNANYYYPVSGGISNFAEGIVSRLKNKPLYNKTLQNLSLKKKTAYFSGGLEINYDNLINTIPLNEFVNFIEDLPGEVKEHSKKLRKNPTTILHLLIKGSINHQDYHWIYFPDRDIPFYRITFPGNINPLNCPEGYSAVTLEFGGNVYKKDEISERSVDILKRIRIIDRSASEIETIWKSLECGYVIYDNLRSRSLDIILSVLRRNNIRSIGRYGSWEYSNMEDAVLHGKRTAESLKESA